MINRSQQFNFNLSENYVVDDLERTQEGWWVTASDRHHARWVREKHNIDHDPYFSSWCADWIEAGTAVLDVGANIGTHAIPYLRRNPSWLIAIEPCPTIFECLRRNLLFQGSMETYRSSVMAYCCAVGQDFGTASFHYNAELPGTSFMTNDGVGGEGIDVRPLSYFTEFLDGERISFMKVDIEGYEPFLLQGARENILNPDRGKDRPVIVMEVNNICMERHGWTARMIFEYMRDELRYEKMGNWPPDYSEKFGEQLLDQPVFEACWRP